MASVLTPTCTITSTTTGRSPTSPRIAPAYPHGHAEHVCAPTPRRRASTSSISLPVRRRSVSQSPVVSPVLAPSTSHVPSHVPPCGPLATVLSTSDLSAKSEKSEPVSELDEKARDVTNSSASNKIPDPELGGIETKLEWNWTRWSGETVAPAALVPALITQALATGILDATTYADFETFASNQTGNAILLTLSAVGTAKVLLALTAVSFGGFLGFAFVFGHVGHWVGVRRRLWLLVSTFLQTIMLVLAAIFLSPHGPRSTALGGQHSWVVLFLFAAMSGAQVAMARQSSCQELPTAPMTSTFVDFVADHYLFAAWSDPRATPRNRRVMYVIAMIGGSFIGAAMHRYSSSWAVVAVSVAVKSVVLVLISVAAADE